MKPKKKTFVLVQRTGFLPSFAYVVAGTDVVWNPHIDLAKRFSYTEARRIVDQLNASHPLLPVQIEERP